MSRHHIAAGWSTISARMRPIIAAQLPLPCINPKAGCPGLVQQGQLWDVAHVGDLATGGDPSQVGPAHRHCNRSAGGKLGASMANANRRAAKRMPKW
jgi:hypothetical protein